MRCAVMSMITIAAGTSVAGAAPIFTSIGKPGDALQFENDTRVEARYIVHTSNWDMRLENDGSPSPGDNTRNVSNSRAFFENQSFDFELSYAQLSNELSFTVSKGGTDYALDYTPAGFGNANVLQLATSGSRGPVSLSDVEFVGLGETVDMFPNIDTQPGGPTFAETFLYFGDDFDLLAGDWSLSGTLSFGSFTHSNPKEGTKLTLKVREAIPAPAGATLACVAACVLLRRRR
ncbi:MAG: hypothetical protein AAFX05_05565 [Planctomycetota bacterium]